MFSAKQMKHFQLIALLSASFASMAFFSTFSPLFLNHLTFRPPNLRQILLNQIPLIVALLAQNHINKYQRNFSIVYIA
jgi:hypothetical protein